MKIQTIAIIVIGIAMAVSVALIAEGFVSYAPLPARQLQAILQSRIVGFGIAILILQSIAMVMLVVGQRRNPDEDQSLSADREKRIGDQHS